MHHTLIVANRTASTPVLLQEIERRAAFRRTAFTLLVPDATSSNWALEDAVKALRRAAAGIDGTRRTYVDGIARPCEDPFEAVKLVVEAGEYDDILVSTLPSRTSLWLKRDLPRRIETLGLPVAVIGPDTSRPFSLFAKGPGSYESGR